MTDVQVYSALVLQLIVGATMYGRGLHEKARYFFAYILWQTFSTVVLYVIWRSFRPYYFFASWTNDLVTVSLGLAIISECFDRFFESYKSVRYFAKLVLLSSLAVLMLIGIVLAKFHDVSFSTPLWTVLLVAERSVRIIQLGLILTLFSLSRYLHLRWKNYLFGILLGFGFLALMTLTGLTVRMYYGKLVFAWEEMLLGTAYCFSLVIWTFYVLQPEVLKVPVVSLPAHELERWDQALTQLLRR
jgi:hypothetical protein